MRLARRPLTTENREWRSSNISYYQLGVPTVYLYYAITDHQIKLRATPFHNEVTASYWTFLTLSSIVPD